MVDMEKYIRDYKHLIGCSFKHLKQKGCYIEKVDFGIWNIEKFYVSVIDNAKYIYGFKNIKLYLSDEDNSTVDYETYMSYHYPEYEHIWREQLC